MYFLYTFPITRGEQMLQSRLSAQGHVIIPKALRTAHNWQPGQNLLFIDTPEGILVRSEPDAFPETTVNEVAGCLKYSGKTKTLTEMAAALTQGIMAQHK